VSFRLAIWLCLAAAAARAAPPIPAEEFRQRRQGLLAALPGALIVLEGASEAETGDLRTGFLQEPNFYYLTGWKEPGAFLLLSPTAEYFFLPPRNEKRERYTGRKAAPGDPNLETATGFAAVESTEQWKARFRELCQKHPKVYLLEEKRLKEAVRDIAPGVEFHDLTLPLARLRMVKSEREIALLQESTDITVESHLAGWRRLMPGIAEYQLAATMIGQYLDKGCERQAYPAIVASGPKALILHYGENKRRIDRGELVLFDVGAECSGYAADLSRTVPAGGKFTPRQRELYEILLGAQSAAIAAAKPGMKLRGSSENSLEQLVKDYLDKHRKGPGGNPLGKYFTHGLGHHVGLQVHDATDPSLPLAAGMVVTIEPGLYIPEENIGIRIEDMVLITANGARIMSAALPREVREIERYFARAH